MGGARRKQNLQSGGKRKRSNNKGKTRSGNKRHKRNQRRCASKRKENKSESVTKLLYSCGRIKNLCKTKTTEHKTIMEYLTRRATRFKKEGRYSDDDLDTILK